MKKLYLVIDCDFNRAWYDDIIGDLFESQPSYVRVKIVYDNIDETDKELYLDGKEH